MAYPGTANNLAHSHSPGLPIASADINAIEVDADQLTLKVGSVASLPGTGQLLIGHTTAGATAWRDAGAFRVDVYGAVGDGVTDDTAAVAAACAAAHTVALSTGSATVAFPGGKTYCAANIPIYSDITYDLGGSIIQLPNGAAAGSDVFRTNNFQTLSGGSTFIGSGAFATTGIPIRWTLKNGTIYGNKANNSNGRHGLALAAGGYVLQNLKIRSCRGSGIWEEFPSSGNTELWQVLGDVAYGEAARYADGIYIWDCDSTTLAPSTNDDYHGGSTGTNGITNITNLANPTITTARPHHLVAGQTITISGVAAPATAANGVWTVLAIPTTTTFTITSGAPGAYSSSGGGITSHTSAQWMMGGPHDSLTKNAIIFQTGSVVPGQRGLLLGTGGGGSSTGTMLSNIHIYGNHHVGVDIKTGGIHMDSNCQSEGAWVDVQMRQGAGTCTIKGRHYLTFAGGTVMSIKDSGQHNIDVILNDVAVNSIMLETWGANDCTMVVNALQGLNNVCTLTAGTKPGRSRLWIYGNSWAGSTMTGGWVPQQPGSTANTVFLLEETFAPLSIQGNGKIWFGAGAPNAGGTAVATADGANGDIYFNTSGGAGTTMYQRRAGVWTATAA